MPDTTGPRTGSIAHANPPGITLEFELPPQEAARLWRLPCVQSRRAGPMRTTPIDQVWHDTPGSSLAAQGLALSCLAGRAPNWRLEPLHPGAAPAWLPATPPPEIATAASPDAIGLTLSAALSPAAAFSGKRRSLPLAFAANPACLVLLEGALRGVARDRPVCRLQLTGAAADIAPFALALAETLPLHVPRQSLAATALALSRGGTPAPRRSATLPLPASATVSEALTIITAHLATAILAWSDQVAPATTVHPVHQMRVAVRRLRSALSIFRRAALSAGEPNGSAWFYELSAALRDLAARLGAARDWDVFLQTTGATVQAAFPDERRITLLLAAATRKQAAAYTELASYFASQPWRRLSLHLALLPTTKPWDQGDPALVQAPNRQYGAQALARRLKPLLAMGHDLSRLQAAELHEIRKQAKRLRYATEFFGPFFVEKAVRKYLPKLEHLQEVLGTVNDAAVAVTLTSQLAGGADRAFAAGVIQGFGAARARRSAAKVEEAWARFVKASVFWD